MISRLSLCLMMIMALVRNGAAAIIGTNPPSQSVTIERITAMKGDAGPWKKYLQLSQRQLKADQAFFRSELKEHGLKDPIVPPSARSVRGLSLNEESGWYAGTEGRRIADIIVSFQTPAGGWSKNLNMTSHHRAPGEFFAGENLSRFLTNSDNDLPHDSGWSYVGTFDNDATITQMRFLAKVVAAAPGDATSPERKAFLRGLDYVFAAQYPNGGWPQVWPLEGGYHDAITYNDDAMLHVVALLSEVAEGKDEFAFVPKAARTQARTAFQRGLDCILATQIAADGRRTVWCQQYDAITLQPCSARNYEMPSQTCSESAEIMLFLMKLPNPNSSVVDSVNAAAAWFEKTRIMDIAYKSNGTDGRQMIASPGAGPLWSRYYEIGTDRPIFGDRDKSIHDQVNEISKERRQGYGWYRDTPKRALEHYARWRKEHPNTAPAVGK